MNLQGKTVLITGASKGIGAAIAARMGSAGAFVIAHYGSDAAGADMATADIEPDRKRLIQADLEMPDAVDRLWAEALAWRGQIDVLINNAAVMLWGGGVDAPPDDWDRIWERTFKVNVLAPARLMREATSHFLPRGGGTIIAISSWTAQRGSTDPSTIAYGASKAAMKAATQTMARAYAKQGINAYIIAPGVVRTRLSEQFAAAQGGEEAVSAGLASGKWVEPVEIADLAVFLASGAAPQLSGATLDMNGASYVR